MQKVARFGSSARMWTSSRLGIQFVHRPHDRRPPSLIEASETELVGIGEYGWCPQRCMWSRVQGMGDCGWWRYRCSLLGGRLWRAGDSFQRGAGFGLWGLTTVHWWSTCRSKAVTRWPQAVVGVWVQAERHCRPGQGQAWATPQLRSWWQRGGGALSSQESHEELKKHSAAVEEADGNIAAGGAAEPKRRRLGKGLDPPATGHQWCQELPTARARPLGLKRTHLWVEPLCPFMHVSFFLCLFQSPSTQQRPWDDVQVRLDAYRWLSKWFRLPLSWRSSGQVECSSQAGGWFGRRPTSCTFTQKSPSKTCCKMMPVDTWRCKSGCCAANQGKQTKSLVNHTWILL